MKKFLSLSIIVIMILTMLPMNVFAAETSSSEYDELITLACEVFPEYSEDIRRGNTSSVVGSRSSEGSQVVYRETRSISDNESIGITLLSSGDIIVLQSNYDNIDLTLSSSSSSSFGTTLTGTASFTVAMSGATFKLSNVKYTFCYDTDDQYFNSYGSVTSSSFYSYSPITQSATKIEYSIRISSVSTAFINFKLYFSNNRLVGLLS